MRYIDAEKIDFEKAFGGESDFARDIRDAANSLISEVPTANVAPVSHANWIVDEDEGLFICSNPECRAEFNDGEDLLSYWRFCPCCGSKMDENRFYKIHK